MFVGEQADDLFAQSVDGLTALNRHKSLERALPTPPPDSYLISIDSHNARDLLILQTLKRQPR